MPGLSLEMWQAAAGLAGSSAAGAMLTKGWDWLAKQNRSQAYTMGAVDHAVNTAMKLVTDRLERVEGQHEECRAELSEVKDRLDESMRYRAELHREIERLMGGRIALIGEPPPPEHA